MDERPLLVHRLQEAREKITSLLPGIDTSSEIYPGWTIKEMLDHMTGWDDAIIASLNAHIHGDKPGTPADQGIDKYNEEIVATRETLNYEQSRKEFENTRKTLIEIIRQMPQDKCIEPMILPWGDTGTVAYLLEIFVDHEEHHAQDIAHWLKDTSQPLTNH